MNINSYPRREYTYYKTPIEQMKNLEEHFGKSGLYIKRDDQLGLTAGGNKTRKLEFLMADALNKGADAIITCGAVQSNHCRLTLSAAVKEGLKCYLLLEERVPGSFRSEASGNNFLYNLLGVTDIKVVPGGTNMMQEMLVWSKELQSNGLKPYVIPGGGSNALGALGYVSCAFETLDQITELKLGINKIIVASGSAGTHAGLLAGLAIRDSDIEIVGISVNRKSEDQRKIVLDLTNKVLQNLDHPKQLDLSKVIVYDQFVGQGYSRVTKGMVDAVNLLARTEGILLDPIYTGKAMAGMLGLLSDGTIKEDDIILFIHTGGSPALYAYEDDLVWMRT